MLDNPNQYSRNDKFSKKKNSRYFKKVVMLCGVIFITFITVEEVKVFRLKALNKENNIPGVNIVYMENGIKPVLQETKYLYAIVERTTIGDKFAKYVSLGKKNSKFTNLILEDETTLAKFLGVFSSLDQYKGAITHNEMIPSDSKIIIKNAFNAYKSLVNTYTNQIIEYGGMPDIKDKRYNVLKIPIAPIDIDKINVAEDKRWVLLYSDIEFVYGVASLEEATKFIKDQGHTIWSPSHKD